MRGCLRRLISQIWSCSVINAIPHDNVRTSQHMFQRAKREKHTSPCFWTRGMVPAEWMEGATRDAQLLRFSEIMGEKPCLVMFLDGTGGPFSSADAAAGKWLLMISPTSPGVKQTVPRSAIYAGSEWSLWSGHQRNWMFASSEFADRQAAKGIPNEPSLKSQEPGAKPGRCIGGLPL